MVKIEITIHNPNFPNPGQRNGSGNVYRLQSKRIRQTMCSVVTINKQTSYRSISDACAHLGLPYSEFTFVYPCPQNNLGCGEVTFIQYPHENWLNYVNTEDGTLHTMPSNPARIAADLRHWLDNDVIVPVLYFMKFRDIYRDEMYHCMGGFKMDKGLSRQAGHVVSVPLAKEITMTI